MDDSGLIGAKGIEHLSPQSLHPNPKNARTHSKRQIKQIATSIDKFGFWNPIIIDESGNVVAGHGRLLAAIMIGRKTVPVIRLEGMTTAQKRAYAIAENRLSELSGWDRGMLAVELDALLIDLPLEGIDPAITGFDLGAIDAMVNDHQATRPDPADEVPPARRGDVVSRLDDLWMLAGHTLLNGDSQKASSFDRLMKGEAAKSIITDPPYNVAVSAISGRGRIKHPNFAFAGGEMTKPQYVVFLETTLGHAAHRCRPGALAYVFIDWVHWDELSEASKSVFESQVNLVVWNKGSGGQGSFYRSAHELVCIYQVRGGRHQNNVQQGIHGRNRTNVWNYPGVNAFGAGRAEALRMHPTVKPIALIADAMRDCTSKGDVVLDPFLGSGTTIMAAEKIGRRAMGIEYDATYVDVAIRRWEAYTGRDAILDGDGRTFTEIAAERRSAALQGGGVVEAATTSSGGVHEQ